LLKRREPALVGGGTVDVCALVQGEKPLTGRTSSIIASAANCAPDLDRLIEESVFKALLINVLSLYDLPTKGQSIININPIRHLTESRTPDIASTVFLDSWVFFVI
jgi:hypothetical protein